MFNYTVGSCGRTFFLSGIIPISVVVIIDAYQETAVNRDSLYTGRDPGGGTRTSGVGRSSGDGVRQAPDGSGSSKKDSRHRVPNPPDKPATVRKGHQRQFSDPFVIDKESGSSKH